MNFGFRLPRIAALLASIFVTAQAASALPPECPTFFPDFRNCDRHGRYEGFGHTYSMPFIFEDPFITTDLRVWGMWHQFPNSSIFDGGDLWGVAAQLRVAITDRLAFIATKDGYAWLNPDNNAVFRNTNGFLNITGGFKYALIDWREHNFILSPSLRFELPTGQDEVFQGWGDSVLIPAVSTAWGIGDLHLIAAAGVQAPFDQDKQSTSVFYHFHADYSVLEHLKALVEISGLHWVGSGQGTIKAKNTKLGFDPSLTVAQAALGSGRFEGADVLNLGSRGVTGNDLVTFAAGLEVPINQHLSVGAIYEFPITNRKDIFNQRVTMAVNLEY